MTLGDAFVNLFSNVSLIPLLLMLVGIMLIIIEFFQPTDMIVGAIGGFMTALGVVIRMMLPDAGLAMLFLMLFSIIFILFTAHILMLILQKRTWLQQSLRHAIYDNEFSVTKSGYSYLKNMTGVATTDINNTGHITINDINFFVTSTESIKKGSLVRVWEVDGEKIVVKNIVNDYFSQSQEAKKAEPSKPVYTEKFTDRFDDDEKEYTDYVKTTEIDSKNTEET